MHKRRRSGYNRRLTPYLEIGGDYREVLPGVFIFELPLPFSLGIINVYLIRLAEGWMLVDTGMNTEACFDALDRAREGVGIAWTDIRSILLTHIHPDHIGLAQQVGKLSGAKVMLHRADVRLLHELADHESSRAFQHQVLRSAGVSQEAIAAMESTLDDIRKTFYRIEPDRTLNGGETIETASGTLQVVWTPGHSPGHVCLYDAARRVLFSGDHILEHISPNIGWMPDHDALGDFLTSLDRIAKFDVDLVLPSHGAPFRGHREWVAKTRAHHAERCNLLLCALDGQSKTAAELIPSLWNRHLSPFHYRFALFELLAHLDHMQRTGRVRSSDEGGVTHWAVV
jgi:glyoxylase-like metal-dependent hydrolase (beta-lactamase superfamily II)